MLIILHWLPLYIGTGTCLAALILTRHSYKLSPGFRARLATTGFFELPLDASPCDKANVMREIWRDVWPATVSEMLQDTEAAHGMVFRSLMIAGCLTGLQCDFAALSPASPPDTPSIAMTTMAIVHLLRRLVLTAAVGFCFAPTVGRDHDVGAFRRETTRPADAKASTAASHPPAPRTSARLSSVPWLRDANVRGLPDEKRVEMSRTMIVGTVHVLLACAMLTLLPQLELVALAWDAWAASSLHDSYRALTLLELGRRVAWCTVALLRLLHVVSINCCMGVFAYHFVAGFFSPDRDHSFRGFWAEYAACRIFAQLVMLAAVQSWFSWPDAFDGLPLALRVLALGATALHVTTADFCVRSLLLCLRNMEYSESELAARFDGGRRQEAMLQTVIDAQLAFIARVQGQLRSGDENSAKTLSPPPPSTAAASSGLGDDSGWAGSSFSLSMLWIAFRQIQLLARWNVVTSDKLPELSACPAAGSDASDALHRMKEEQQQQEEEESQMGRARRRRSKRQQALASKY